MKLRGAPVSIVACMGLPPIPTVAMIRPPSTTRGRHGSFPGFRDAQQFWVLLPRCPHCLQNSTHAFGHSLAKCPSCAHLWQARRGLNLGTPSWVNIWLVASFGAGKAGVPPTGATADSGEDLNGLRCLPTDAGLGF
ncbi:hypothetical protein ACLKA7_000781 [Drosophila subpalustris]